MAWQQSGGYPYPGPQGPPPAGFYPSGGAAPYLGQAPYPGAAGAGVGGVYPGATQYTGQGQPTGGGMSYNTYDYNQPGSGGDTFAAFSDKTIRQGFIRKVYLILMVQLAITCVIIAFFVSDEKSARYFQRNSMYLILAFVITIVCMVAMACCESARRTPPTNYIFLFIFTFAEGFLLGVISSTYSANEVLLAVGICTVLCFALSVFAFQTKWDFTAMGGILLVACLILLIFGIVLMFMPNVKPLRLLYACFGAFLFSVYLIYDTQLMMGGSHKYSISPEEYVFAALNIYLDIVNIFIYILSIIGESRD